MVYQYSIRMATNRLEPKMTRIETLSELPLLDEREKEPLLDSQIERISSPVSHYQIVRDPQTNQILFVQPYFRFRDYDPL